MTGEEIRREGVRRHDRETDRRKWVYPLAAVFATMFASVGVNMVYTTVAVNESARNWCEIVTSLDNEYKAHPPPATQPGAVAFAAQMHRLRIKLKCG